MNTVYNSFRKIETIEGFVNTYYNCYNRAEFSYGYDESRTVVTFQSKATSNDPYIETHKKYYLSNYEYYLKANQDTKEVTYISTRNGVVAAIINETNQPERTVYIHKDYLGSIQSLSEVNSQGNVVILAEFSFDAWGRARSHTDWDENFQSDASVPGFAILERGFTGHEHIIQFGIINMNARLYDPIIASFLSPDDVVSDPENLQNYNRYSYALNDPMRYTDPSGNNPMFAAMFIKFIESTSKHGIGPAMLSLGASAVSYGIGTFVNMGFNSIFSNNSALASFSISIAAAITTDAITGLIFEGKYTGASALYSVFSSAKGWVMNYLEYSSQSMNEVSENNEDIGENCVHKNIKKIKIIVNGKVYEDESAVKEFVAIVAGESSNDIKEATGIGEVILRRLKLKGNKLEGDFISKIGGKDEFDAIGSPIYNEIKLMDWNEINDESNPYKLRIKGAAEALGDNSNLSNNAYFWNASKPEKGFLWKNFHKDIFEITTTLGKTTFFKYNSNKFSNKRWP